MVFRVFAAVYHFRPEEVCKLTMPQLMAYMSVGGEGASSGPKGSVNSGSSDNADWIAAAKRLKEKTGKSTFSGSAVYDEMKAGQND